MEGEFVAFPMGFAAVRAVFGNESIQENETANEREFPESPGNWTPNPEGERFGFHNPFILRALLAFIRGLQDEPCR